MNSKNSTTSDLRKLVLHFADKVDLRRCNKYIALSNLSIYYTRKNIRSSYKSKKFQPGAINSNYLMDHIS